MSVTPNPCCDETKTKEHILARHQEGNAVYQEGAGTGQNGRNDRKSQTAPSTISELSSASGDLLAGCLIRKN